MEHQDWKPVVLRKSNKAPRSQHELARAKKSGDMETVKKQSYTKTSSGIDARKLDDNEGEMKLPTVSHEFKIALMQARQAKKMTQAQLAQRINVKQSIINEYEAGKAIPNPQIVSKLQRALGCKLPKTKKKK